MVLAVVAAGGTLWWVNTRGDAPDPLGTGPGSAPAETTTVTATPAPRDAPPPPVPPDEIERLVNALREAPTRDARLAAVQAIARQGRAAAGCAAAAVTALQAERDADVRTKLVWALGLLSNSDAAGALRRAARSDPAENVRREAVRALRNVATLEADDVFQAIDAEQSPTVRAAWTAALGRVRDPRVQPRLMRLLAQDHGTEVKVEALRLLGRMAVRDEGKLHAVIEDRLRQDGDLDVRRAAAEALVLANHPDARTKIESAIELERDPRGRAALREVLAELSDAPAAAPGD